MFVSFYVFLVRVRVMVTTTRLSESEEVYL